jgi:peptidoglycan/xylan/chitin deacetylase (PgdA/CDA1 family)
MYKKLLRLFSSEYKFKSGAAFKHSLNAIYPVVLAYHRVIEYNDPAAQISYPDLHVSVNEFEKQMILLKKYFNILSCHEFTTILNKNGKFPPRSCLITFDDGWLDNYTNAAPVLNKLLIPSTIFLATKMVEDDDLYWTHKLYALIKYKPDIASELVIKYGMNDCDFKSKKRNVISIYFQKIIVKNDKIKKSIIDEIETLFGTFLPQLKNKRYFMNWNEVRSLGNMFTIGSHSHSHEPLSLYNNDLLKCELIKSKQIIEKETGKTVNSISFPHSKYSENVFKNVSKTEYEFAFGDEKINESIIKPQSLKLIPRTAINRKCMAFTNAYNQSVFYCSLVYNQYNKKVKK